MDYRMTQGAYDYLLHELEAAKKEVIALEETRKILSNDGTDDENPAYGYNTQMLNAAHLKVNQLQSKVAHAIIVEAEPVEGGAFSENAKSITLQCNFESEDEWEEEKLEVSREGYESISPASPLFNFLVGKKPGFVGRFQHQTENVIIEYDVKIVSIEF